MQSNARPREMDFTATAQLSRDSYKLINRKIWLPKLLYDGLPLFYLLAGVLALVATLYIGAWYWVVPHYVLFSAGCLHLFVTVVRRRRRPRDPVKPELEK
ncbi:MAG: hypothetical protein ACR2Q3_16140 [Woeseiaceae bacterium]